MTWGAYEYEMAALDEHMRTCAACQCGSGCPAGEDAAEREFRAWRLWERDNADAAHTYRRDTSRC